MSTQQAILVIDDDKNLARVVQAGLDRAGYDVTVAHDAGTGLSHLLRRSFGLVLLDHHLAHLDGVLALPVLKATASSETAFILLTGYDEPGLRDRAQRAGATGVYLKPFDLPELLAGVRHTLAEVVRRSQGTGLLPVGGRVAVRVDDAVPEVLGRVVLARGDRFTIEFLTSAEAVVGARALTSFWSDDGIYEFRSAVVEAGGDRVSVAKPSLIRRRQRRRHARWPLPLPCTVDPSPGEPGGVQLRGIGKDVSRSGVSIASSHGLPPGCRVRITWPGVDPAAGQFSAGATIVRDERVSADETLVVHSLGARFTHLTSAQQAQLTSYLQPH